MAEKINRREFLATATAATVVVCAGEQRLVGEEQKATRILESTLVPSRSGKWTDVARNRAAYQSSSADDEHAGHVVTDGSPQTYWKCGAGNEQWISVDLGRSISLGRLTIHWGQTYATTYRIEVSEEEQRPQHWTPIYSTVAGNGGVEELPLDSIQAHHLRLVGDASAGPFSICELHAWSAQAMASGQRAEKSLAPQIVTAHGADLTTGWQLQCAMFTKSTAEQIASAAYLSADWIPATVPGTVLASYLIQDAIPDPHYANQFAQISDGFFTRNDFWYRNNFSITSDCKRGRLWLVLEGINWKADIYFNGKQVGTMDGAFIRGRFDVTELAVCGGLNCIAVCIKQVAHPGEVEHKTLGKLFKNGGELGLDSPTFLASIGWNWIPTIPGRNIGIWNHVRFEITGDVVLRDPWITSKLPNGDHARAELTARTAVCNLSSRPLPCVLHLEMDGRTFQQNLTLQPNETRAVSLDKSAWPQLEVQNPRLWWPNGYGEPALYNMKFRVESAKSASDEKTVIFGIRTIEYKTDGGILSILVNGHKILCRGGNWGMDDALLMCDKRGYDLRVRMHRDANLNMIRNWIGMIGKNEFYDACDHYGMLIWDDFWLANPGDGPEPQDNDMFMRNTEDKIRRVRSHASVAIYCGRNEGMPPADLDRRMNKATEQLDGTRYYIPASDRGLVTGHGPYENEDPEWYFANRGGTFHTEQGIVCVPPVESMRAMMPEEDLWPISDMWAVHDYQQNRSPLYTQRIEDRYGRAEDIEDYCRKSQMVNLESAKAIFECLQSKQGGGQIAWMTQAAWPCLICQMYDYYFEQTGAFFGAKTACEPLHILWDQASRLIKVANNTLKVQSDLRAEAWVYDLHGREQSHRMADLSVPSATAATCFPLLIDDLSQQKKIAGVFFVKLVLSKGKEVLSQNFYWNSTEQGDFKDLNTLEKVSLSAAMRMKTGADEYVVTVKVSNPTTTVALAVRLMLLHGQTKERILPAFYDDNYFSLLPLEEKSVSIRVPASVLGSQAPRLAISGWNVNPEYDQAS